MVLHGSFCIIIYNILRYGSVGCTVIGKTLLSNLVSLLCTADAFQVMWSKQVLWAPPSCSSWIHHQNTLTEKAAEDVVLELGKVKLKTGPQV